MTLDTYGHLEMHGRKAKARRAHILAAVKCRHRLDELTPAAIKAMGPISEAEHLLLREEAQALNAKIRYHEAQVNIWGKSIALFGDEEEE